MMVHINFLLTSSANHWLLNSLICDVGHVKSISGLASDPINRILISSSLDGTVKVIDYQFFDVWLAFINIVKTFRYGISIQRKCCILLRSRHLFPLCYFIVTMIY